MYGKPSPIAAAAAGTAAGEVFGGVTWAIIGGITALVVIGLIVVRIASRRGRR